MTIEHGQRDMARNGRAEHRRRRRCRSAYTAGRLQRDRLAGWLAVIAPPVLLERSLQTLAGTGLRASLAYEARVRAFHASLREFYFPKLFPVPRRSL